MDREARLQPEMRNKTVGGGARKEASLNSEKMLPRCKLDTNKNQVQLLCLQSLKRARSYSEEEMHKHGWSKQQRTEWNQRQDHREAAYKKQYENLVSTCWHTASGRKRGDIVSVFELAKCNPIVLKPGQIVAKNRMSCLSRKQATARKKVVKNLEKGDKSCSTGIPARGNRM